MFNRLRIFAIGAAYAFGLTSFFTYYTADDSNLLLASVLVIMLAHFVVAIGTIRTTLDVASGKRKNSAPAQQNTSPTIRLWKQAIRRAWPWHAALIIPKMGLSLAFVQYLYMSYIYVPVTQNIDGYAWPYFANRYHLNSLFRSYNYISYFDIFHRSCPQLETVLLALVIIIAFFLSNVSLLVAITLVFRRKRVGLAIADTLLLRTLLGIIISTLLIITYSPIIDSDPISLAIEGEVYSQIYYPELHSQHRTYWRIVETIYTSSLSIAEQGVLLSANIMRPVDQYSLFAGRYNQQTHTYYYDNRPFVLRQMVAAALGLGLYGLLTWGALRLAKRGEKPLP